MIDFAAMARTVHIRIADQIGRNILHGDILPGELLPTEAKFCEILGVSRTAVREAMRMLNAKGLIESRPKCGTRVRPRQHWNYFDSDVLKWLLSGVDIDLYLKKVYDLRQIIEPSAAALAAQNATEDDCAYLQACIHRMAAADTIETWIDADLAFHKSIYLATQNELFWPIGQLFQVSLRESFRIALAHTPRLASLAEHQEVATAIAVKDPARAQAATLVLLQHSAADIALIRGKDIFSDKP